MLRVSVVMPCYNHARFLKASVRSILDQTVHDLELIVVDDASTDDSVKVIHELAAEDSRLKVIVHSENLGASRSRNDGLRLAQGEFVAFCDADDLWKPEKIERQINLLSAGGGYDISYCDAEIIDERGELTGKLFSTRYPVPMRSSGDLFEALTETNFINMQTVLVRRQVLGQRLFFDENIRWVEDWWQWIRLARHHRFIYDPARLALYRVHSHSTNRTQRPGILRNRCKVAIRNLRAHPEMTVRIQALLWHQIGVGLCILNHRKAGLSFLCHSIHLGRRGGLSLSRLARFCGRVGLEWIRIWK